MNNKKQILIFIDWFLPGTKAGGPVRSVFSIVKLLNKNYHFRIFTSNTDLFEENPYKGIESDKWITFDNDIDIFYCSKINLSKQTLTNIIQELNYHKIYINSLYSKNYSILPLQITKKAGINHKVVLSPRGMLGKGARAIKPIKKYLFLKYAKFLGLHKEILWQASSVEEEKDIRNFFTKKAKVKVVPNLSYIEQQTFNSAKKNKNELNLFFLSRIVPIKNLAFALNCLKNISPEIIITYHIYGFIEDKQYYQTCVSLAKTLPQNIKVVFYGEISHDKLALCLSNQHALFMLTLNENFGHSILESFSLGKPVIISDQTPWNNLENMKIGCNIPINEKEVQKFTIDAIQKFGLMEQREYHLWSENAFNFAASYLQNNSNIQKQIDVFE